MDVGASGSTQAAVSAQALQRTPEPQEVQEPAKPGRDRDGDKDDGNVNAVKAAPAPTVNSRGEAIGQVINVAA